MQVKNRGKDFPKSERILLLLLVTMVGGLWLTGFTSYYFQNPDAYDYAQMGREILTGNGFRTLQIFPRHVFFMAEQGYLNLSNGHWPNLYRYPVPTLANAFFQFFVDDIVQAAIIQSGTWFLMSVPLLFFLARKLTNTSVAFLTILVYLSDNSVWISSYSGMTESLSTFLVLLVFFIAFIESGFHGLKWFLLGVVCGISFITRTQLAYLLVFALIIPWAKTKSITRLQGTILVIMGFLAIITPWATRNYILTSNPLFSFSTTRNLVLYALPSHSDIEMQLHAPITTSDIMVKYGTQISQKVYDNIWSIIKKPVRLIGSEKYAYFAGFIFVTTIATTFITTNKVTIQAWQSFPQSLWRNFFAIEKTSSAQNNILPEYLQNKNYRLLKWSVLGIVLLNFLIISLAFYRSRFYQMFNPLIAIIGVQEFLLIINLIFKQKLKWLKYGVIIAAIFGFVFAFIVTIRKTLTVDDRAMIVDQASYQLLKKYVSPKNLMVANNSHKTALFTEIPSLRLPADPYELLEIDENYVAVDYILLSAYIVNADPNQITQDVWENYANYAEFIQTEVFLQKFEHITQLPDGSMLYKKIRLNP